MEEFLGVYEGVLSRADCDGIISRFDESGEARPGETGSGVDRTIKDSLEIALGSDQWRTVEKMVALGALSCLLVGAIHLQKYGPESAGYRRWHSETYPRDERCETLHRLLFFILYLNDVPEGGETEFLFQRRKVTPRAGTMLIAPAAFTHTRRGNPPLRGDKYLATWWVLFQRAETLFSQPAGAP